jgi:capsule polysaccharide export protein KpsE/RkpR
MEQKDNLLGVVETVFKWKKIILITCLVTAVGTAIITLLLPVYYKSTTIFYAASPDLAIPESIFGTSAKAPNYYGTENDMDRLLSIAKSGELATFMIDSFNLYEHYGIDRNSPLGPYNIRLKFAKYFDVVKTKYDAIELSVEDQDKELAARMANAARERINFLGQKLIKDSQAKIIVTYEDNIKQKETDLLTLSNSLQQVRQRYGVFNPLAQSEGLSDLAAKAEAKLNNSEAKVEALKKSGNFRDSVLLLQANISGYKNEVTKLNERLKTLNIGMAPVEVLKNTQDEASEQLAKDKERYKQTKAAFASDFPATLLLESGPVPLIKSRPKRALTVLAATLAAFVFSIIGVIIFETYRDVDWRTILHIGTEDDRPLNH